MDLKKYVNVPENNSKKAIDNFYLQLAQEELRSHPIGSSAFTKRIKKEYKLSDTEAVELRTLFDDKVPEWQNWAATIFSEMSQIKQLQSQTGRLGTAGKADLELHYFTRERSKTAYLADLTDDALVSLTTYFDNEDPDRDLTGVMARQPLGTHLYVCGPKPMINIVIEQARSVGWPDENIHHEEFVAPQPGKPFAVELARSGLTVNVGERQSLLEAIEEAGVDAPYMCRGGACGQCETKIVSCEGTVEHRDHWLTDEQRANNEAIMPCMSRFVGNKLVLER